MSTTVQTIARPTKESRLHLYVASACPFCHRVVATLAMNGLTDQLTYTLVHNVKGPEGWEITPSDEPAFGARFLSDVYARFMPDEEQRHSVPLLVDLTTRTILSTSSPEQTRFFATGMNGALEVPYNLCPDHLVREIDELNAWLHTHINRAVYLVGFTLDQADYDAKVADLFIALDSLEKRLGHQPFLFAETLTESDLYLFATLVRFDSVYYPLFKCSYRLIREYPSLSAYLGRLEAIQPLKNTVNRRSYKEHYFLSSMHVEGKARALNPSKIIPVDSFIQ